MTFIHFLHENEPHFGVLPPDSKPDEYVVSLGKMGHDLPACVKQIIASADQIPGWIAAAKTKIPLQHVKLLPPVTHNAKVICIGRNYAEHAEEMKSEVGNLPVVFNKLPSCIIGPDEPIRLPTISEQVDFEAELVVVIGKKAHNISPTAAREHVFGFCCGNDVTARDWQKGRPGNQWLLGKACDTFAPLGPWLVAADDVDENDLNICSRLNGRLMQQSNTSQLIFKIDYLISHLSRFFTLAPGDLLFTGTPSGVGAGRTPPVFLQAGDVIEVEIDGLGVLRNPVLPATTPDAGL